MKFPISEGLWIVTVKPVMYKNALKSKPEISALFFFYFWWLAIAQGIVHKIRESSIID